MSDSKERVIGGLPFSEYNKRAAKKRYDRLKAAGVCPRCGAPRDRIHALTGKLCILCKKCDTLLTQGNKKEVIQE